MMQAPRFKCLSFDPVPLLHNGFVVSKVDVGGCDVAQGLVVALVIIMIYTGLDLSFQNDRQEVVFQQDAVLQNLIG